MDFIIDCEFFLQRIVYFKTKSLSAILRLLKINFKKGNCKK